MFGLTLNTVVVLGSESGWNVDFNQFYSAGKLVGSGRLYDWESLRALELQQNIKPVPFGRIPAFAIAFKPLSLLGYPVARALWLSIEIAALGGFVCLWPLPSRPWAWAALCSSLPVFLCLALGQDSVLFLFFVGLGLNLLHRRFDIWAGLAFAACIAKPQLALLLPFFLIGRGKWKAFLSASAGVTASILLSFAEEGKEWPARLLSLARMPEFDPAPERMPNFRGLLAFVDGGIVAEIVLLLIMAIAVWLISRRQDLATAGAITLAGGLLISHHAYVYDVVLLLPALLLPFQGGHSEWLRKWAIFLFSPTPYLFQLSESSIGAVLANVAVTGYTLALVVVLVRRGPLLSDARS